MELKFSDFSQHPLLQTKRIDGVLSYFYVSAKNKILGEVMPLKNVNADKVVMDYDKAQMGGMTPAVAAGAESPLYDTRGRGQREWEPAEFREKVKVMEQELIDLRKLGTLGDLEGAMELLQKKYMGIQNRLSNRIEWMRRQVLFDQQVVAPVAGSVAPLVVNYEHPAYLRPTTGTTWDNAAADPLDDLQRWAEIFRLYSGFDIKKIYLPHGTLRLLTNNDRFREIATGSWAAMNGSQEAIRQQIITFLGVGDVVESHDRIDMVTELTAEAASGQATATLRDVTELAAGDRVILRSQVSFETAFVEVLSVAGNVVTFTANLPSTFEAGAVARYHKFTIPDGKILMVGTPMLPPSEGHQEQIDAEYLTDFADVASTYSRYETLNPKAGLFSKMINHIDDGDPPHIEQIIGIRCLPRVHYQDGWMVPSFL